MNCDLHTHTNHSDGSLSPEELVLAAKEKNLIIALTDHNTVSGLPSFLAEAERLGVVAVGGTELSTVYHGEEFHLLGLFISSEHYDKVEALCREYHLLKEESNIALVKRLADAGYVIDYARAKERNVKGNVNRAHIAAELVDAGYFGSVREAFDRVLDEKCGYYVPPRRLELVDAIRFLREIESLPVLAHPLKDVDADYLRAMLPELIEAGLVSMETMHSSYSDEQIYISQKIAAEFDLLESGGSDFHGGVKPGIELGTGKGNLIICDEIYYSLLARQKELFSKK